jgi:hypothetical protein
MLKMESMQECDRVRITCDEQVRLAQATVNTIKGDLSAKLSLADSQAAELTHLRTELEFSRKEHDKDLSVLTKDKDKLLAELAKVNASTYIVQVSSHYYYQP